MKILAHFLSLHLYCFALQVIVLLDKHTNMKLFIAPLAQTIKKN